MFSFAPALYCFFCKVTVKRKQQEKTQFQLLSRGALIHLIVSENCQKNKKLKKVINIGVSRPGFLSWSRSRLKTGRLRNPGEDFILFEVRQRVCRVRQQIIDLCFS